MMGRAAYQEPWRLLGVDPLFFGEAAPFASAKEAALALIPYIEREMAGGVRLHSITRHVLGLFRAVPGARAFRRHLSVEAVKPGASAQVMADALALVVDSDREYGAHRRLTFSYSGATMLLGYPIGEIVWLALLDCRRRRRHRHARRPVRHRRRRHHRAGAVRSLRRHACAGRRPHAAVHRHLARHHRADHHALLLGAQEKRRGDPDVVRVWALPAVVGVVIGSATAAFAPGAVFKIAFVVFAFFIAPECCSPATAGRRHRIAGPRMMRFYGFIIGLLSSLVGVSGGSVSNMVLTLYGQPIQRAVATSAGVGVPITIAGAIGYVIAGWPHIDELPPLSLGFVSLIGFARDGAGVELHRVLWRAAGALAAAPPARNRLRHFSDDGVAALHRQPCSSGSALTACRACAAGRRAPPSFPAG